MTSPEISPSTQEQIETCLSGADILFKSGDHDGALAILNELRAMFPESSEVLFALALHYSKLGKADERNKVHQDLLILAGTLQGADKIEAAMVAYKTVNKIAPSIIAYANLAFLRTLKARQILAAS